MNVKRKCFLANHIQTGHHGMTMAVAYYRNATKINWRMKAENRDDRSQKGYLGIDNITESSVLKNLYKRYFDIFVQLRSQKATPRIES